MRNPKKFVACTLVLTMVAGCGCGKTPKRANEVVSADSTWYTMEKHELTLDYDTSEFDYVYSDVLGKVGDYYAVETTGDYMIPPDVDWETIDYSDYSVTFIDFFDEQGSHVNSIELMDTIKDSGALEDFDASTREESSDESEPDPEGEEQDAAEAPVNYTPMSVDITGDSLEIIISVYHYQDYNHATDYALTVDPATGAVSYETVELDDVDGYNEGTETVGDYQVEKIWLSEGFGSYLLKISDSTGLVNSVNLAEKLPGEDIGYIDTVFLIDEDTLLFAYYSSGVLGNDSFFTVNVHTGEVKKDEDGEYSWINNYGVYRVSYFEDIGNVILTDDGIQIIDFENKTLSEVFSFNCCNVNRYDISCMQLIDYTEDQITFVGTVYRGYTSVTEIDTPQLIVLTKADTNPNAGKTILTAASISGIDYATSEAVCIFNETDPDYFILFDDKYKTDNFLENVNFSDSEESERAYDNAAAELGNQLTVDLMAGDGPDIIFGASSLSQLNNDDYLLDLADEISAEGLFANVIESAKTGDKLYQLPLTFGVTGIAVFTDDLDAGQNGFTFDQYADFVGTTCNGHDPLSMEQTEFFVMCMDAMSEQFITEDGKVSYDNEAFRALAEYTKDNVFPPIDDGVDIYGGVSSTESDMGMYRAVRFELSYFDAFVQLLGRYANESTIVGLPSIDGRGPMLSVNTSVAVSSQTAEAEACLRFVRSLLSSDIQEYYAASFDGCPISIAAFETSSRNAVNYYNEIERLNASLLSPAELAMLGEETTELDYEVIDNYEAMIDSCSSVAATDPAISVIIREEMPAYFSGQKTLDDVISVMEDRVQTFLDERD